MSGQEKEQNRIEQLLQMLRPAQGDGTRSGQTISQGEAARDLVRFLDEMPGGFLIYYADRGEEIIYANRALLRIFQCETMEELRAHTGNSFRGLVHPDDLEEVEESIRSQIAASQYDLDYVEYRICRRDGAVRWIEDYGHFVHSESLGDIFYVFLGDATEKHNRMLLEKKLLMNEGLEREQKLQDLIQEYDKERSLINQEYLRQLEVIEGLSVNYESICYVDLDLDQIVPYRVSCRTSVLFSDQRQDRSYSQYADSYVSMWVHPEDRELVSKSTAPDYIRLKLAEGQTYYVNYRVLVEEELQYLQLRLVNVGRGDGVGQVVLGYRRVDEEIRHQMEQQALLAEALTKANLAVASKNAFLSNMSHDMRTPLHAIFGFTSLAKANVGSCGETAEYLDQVEAASRRLLDMIDKVLEVSALADGSGLEEQECDLREVVRQAGGVLQAQAWEKDVAFTLDCGGLDKGLVYADQGKLRQLIAYLGSNAVTYTNPGGRVAITAALEKRLPNGYGVYRFTVEDTGVGISPEFLKWMFEPFSREKNSTQSGVHGVGLGLTIAKSIVDLMGGALEVESRVGEGSTFTATLTLRPQPGVQPKAWPAAQPEPEMPPLARPVQRLLLVEDNDLNREIETELLSRLGYAIDTAENGLAAVNMVRGAQPGKYDLVLMDLQMPVMDGWQAAREIRALPDPALARIPIVALSANVMERDRSRSRECGINVHLAKPMDLSLVVSTIEKLTGKKCPS